MVTAWSGTTRPATWSVSPNGIEAKATSAKKTETAGARSKSSRSARAGRKSSFVSILRVSASGWNRPRARKPKMDARFAPMRSCMIADCLRSTQPSSAATFSTNSITNITRPNAIPRSISMLWARRRRHGERVSRVADQLIAEPREGRHRGRELAEPVLGAHRRGRLAQRRQHAGHDLPFGQRLAQRLDRLAEALNPSLEVRVRPLALDPRRGRQHPVGMRARPVRVGAGEDDGVDDPERFEHVALRQGAGQEIVPEDPQELEPPRPRGLDDGPRVAAQAHQL